MLLETNKYYLIYLLDEVYQRSAELLKICKTPQEIELAKNFANAAGYFIKKIKTEAVDNEE